MHCSQKTQICCNNRYVYCTLFILRGTHMSKGSAGADEVNETETEETGSPLDALENVLPLKNIWHGWNVIADWTTVLIALMNYAAVF
jgi:hypothetical protein